MDASADARHCVPEICGNGLDDNCNGRVDEGCLCALGTTEMCYPGDPSQAGVGVCAWGTATCVTGTGDAGAVWGDCIGAGEPGPEICDGIDHLCNGFPLTDCQCINGTSQTCYTGPMGTLGVGVCMAGTHTCISMPDGTRSVWSTCMNEVTPSPNLCDGVDRSCSGDPFQGCICHPGTTESCYDGAASTRNVGICRDGMHTCALVPGGGANWGVCNGEVTPRTEICDNGLDDDCNGRVDDGCGPMVMCPPPVTTPAGTAVSLTVVATTGPTRAITSYAWTITAAPMGGMGTPGQWSPDPPAAATEQFLPYIIGHYTLHIVVTDSHGDSSSCDTTVDAVGHGLRVELTWDGSADLDLHVHNGMTSSPWFTMNDCYYGNCKTTEGAQLDWDAPGIGGDDPSLDFDNVTANGPENTRIDTPVVGETYTVAVHNYRAGEGRIATVQIFCGNTDMNPTFMRMSQPLMGNDAGDCTSSSFWKVASVVFVNESQCNVTPIDTYTASSDRCMSF